MFSIIRNHATTASRKLNSAVNAIKLLTIEDMPFTIERAPSEITSNKLCASLKIQTKIVDIKK